MATQRVHDITQVKIKELTDSINNERVKLGEKKLTVPDVLNEAVNFMYTAHLKALKQRDKG